MKREILDSLHVIFSKYEAKLHSEETAKNQEESRRRAFVKEFYQKRDLIIRPAMDAIGSFLLDRGHSFEIVTQDDDNDVAARIEMRIYPQTIDANTKSTPHFAVICNKSSGSVQFHESTLGARRGGQVGEAGDSTLSDLSVENVQNRLVKLLAQIFR
jgi:hypothetical protein